MTSARVAAVIERANARRSREQRALRMLSLPLLLVVIVPAINDRPAASLHGRGLAVAAALVALSMSFAVVLWRGRVLDSGEAALWPTVAALIVMATAGVALIAEQPSGTGALVLSLVAFIAGSRLALRDGLVLTAAATAADGVALALGAGGQAISIASSALLAVLLFIIARLFGRAQADRQQAEVARAQLEDARQGELEAAAVAERGRLARELHDVLAHSLSGLSLQLESARILARHEQVSEELQDILTRSRRLAAEGLEDARRAMRALRGEALPGLDDLPRLVEDFRAGGLTVDLEISGERRRLPEETALAVYRATQEALTNVVRHSGAGAARVEVAYGPSSVLLTVADHGGGDHPPPAVLTGVGSGFGLGAMRERSELLGGRLMAGPDGAGFRVELELPA